MAKKRKRKKAKKKSVKKAIETKPSLVTPSQTFSPLISSQPKVVPCPTAGSKVQDFEDKLDAQLAGDTGPPVPKRGPGRPPKEKIPEPDQPDELTIDVVAGVVKIPFELWAISQGIEKLALDDKKALQIAEPAKQLLEFYLPKIPVIAYAWVSVSISAFWVLQERLTLIQSIRKQRGDQEPPAPAEPSEPGVITKFPMADDLKQNKV